MVDTVFTDGVTPIVASWANDVNLATYGTSGLIRTLTPAGGARIREYGDVLTAATTGAIEYGITFNVSVNVATGVWAGRDVAGPCFLEKWNDAGTSKEFWYAASAAAGVAPVWVLSNSFGAATGASLISGNLTIGNSASDNHLVNGNASFSGIVDVNGLRSPSPTQFIGHSAGAGGTVTQATSKSTAVTLAKVTGQITMNAASLAANTSVSFAVNLTGITIAPSTQMILTHASGGTFGAYALNGRYSAANQMTIDVRNLTAGALAEAIAIQYSLYRGVTA